SAPKETTIKDAAPKESVAQENATRESAPNESATQEAASPPPVAAESARAAEVDSTRPVVKVALKRNGENLSLTFPFARVTPAAIFSRADTLWLVFDTDAAIDLGK